MILRMRLFLAWLEEQAGGALVKDNAGNSLPFCFFYMDPNSPIPWISEKLLLPTDTGLH